MRGNAKAPSAGSNLGQAGSLGTVLRARFAVKGSSAPSLIRLAGFFAPLALTLAALLAASAPASAETCPNEARRQEQGAPGRALSDCRAYELVSPSASEPDAGGGGRFVFPASVSGDRIGFYTEQGPPAGFSPSPGHYFLSSRRAGGWATYAPVPPQSTSVSDCFLPYIAAYSADLSKMVLADGKYWTGYTRHYDEFGGVTNPPCGHDEPLLVPGEPQGAQNLFLHESEAPSEAGFYQLLNLNQPQPGRNAYYKGGSTDLSHVVFSSPTQLTPEAPLPPERTGTYAVGEDLYENFAGTVRLLTILPDGTPVWGRLAGAIEDTPANGQSAGYTHPVSADGERVFFYEGEFTSRYPNGNDLYLRQNAAQEPSAISGDQCTEPAKACTVQVDANQGGSGGAGVARFEWASADGSRAFFLDCAQLTAESTAVTVPRCAEEIDTGGSTALKPEGNDLYEYDADRPLGQRLTDLTVDSSPSDPYSLHADVQGLAGISKDGSSVYFVADGKLTTQKNSQGEEATAGQPNLYLRHAGATTFIATLEPPAVFPFSIGGQGRDYCDWQSFTQATEDNFGNGACTTSRVSTDGRFLAFTSHKRLTGYDNTSTATGLPAREIFLYDAATGELSCASCNPNGPPTVENTPDNDSGSAEISEPQLEGEYWQSPYLLSTQLSDRGQVFFSTTESLVPGDINNGVEDAYEYEAGELHLLSSGESPDPSRFREASPSGENVFITTAQGLVRSDTDSATSLYDARVGGGFSEPPPPVTCETEEACHTAHQEPPPTATPGTAHFEGPGNELRCPSGFGKKRASCVKRKKHQHKRHHRHAHRNRRGSK